MKRLPMLGIAGILAVTAVSTAQAGFLDLFIAKGSRDARAGLDAYGREDWVDAMTRFTQARDAGADPGIMDFDLGAAAYRNGDYETALRGFNASLRTDAVSEADAAYNTGNALYKAQQLPDALKAYRAALRADPNDEDARHNYEVVLQQMEQQESQSQDEENPDQDQEQSEEQQDQDSENQDESQEQESGNQDQEGEQPEKQDGEQSGEEQSPEQGGEDQGEQQPADPTQLLSKEEAERLLNALSPQERELIEARLKAGKRRRVEKDW